jgi:aldehyde dehydrogenase (NAD+)
MNKTETSEQAEISLNFFNGWKYASAPESKDHIHLKKQYDLFINGKFIQPSSKQYFDTINPATEEKIAEVADAGDKDVDLAVTAAAKAYNTVWKHMSGKERGKYIYRIARMIQERAREFAVIETMDCRKND